MRRFLTLLLSAFCVALVSGQGRTTLDIYVIDVEGGNATLFVAPSGQSLLIDTGNGGAAAQRDGDRILAATKAAGLTQIDHLITTHFHGDHYGGMENVAGRIPIKEFIDHGPNVQPAAPVDTFLKDVYPKLYASSKHTIAKPGDKVELKGVDARIVAAAGQFIANPLPGGGKNPYCAAYKQKDPDPSENAQSVGTHFTFGKFRTVHMGDLTWNKEGELMCPTNRLGTVDLYLVSHHGLNISNSEALIHALSPRVAIMNNGTRKGGQPDSMRVLFTSPGLEDLWQMHFSQLSGQENTVPGLFIANNTDEALTAMPVAAITAPAPGPGAAPPPAHNGQAYWFKVSAREDGSFTVTNTRNGFSKTYAAKR
ncbi:MAG TPA: MBL fold metallo-hydrolase [Vicinamibacterales bacterium]|jgi:beta-lactamase superfamily II metal-dependent hydrolase